MHLYQFDENLGTMFNDETRLRQSLLNFLSNACKFTNNGTVKFSARSIINNDEPYLEFLVEDSGIGLKDIKSMINEKKVIFAHNRKPNDPSISLSRLTKDDLPKYVSENLDKYDDWIDK